MRRASAALVPLLLAIVALFWFIWFLGGANDNLHQVNQIEHLQHTQEKLLIPAIKKKYELKQEHADDANITQTVNSYIKKAISTSIAK